jgi:hypothetical protein
MLQSEIRMCGCRRHNLRLGQVVGVESVYTAPFRAAHRGICWFPPHEEFNRVPSNGFVGTLDYASKCFWATFREAID